LGPAAGGADQEDNASPRPAGAGSLTGIETGPGQVDTDDDLEVDDKPLYSYGDDGVLVSAWVHIRHPETDEEEEAAA